MPEIINCDGEEGCSEDFIEGTEVTLTATAATGSTFTGWNGACGATPIEVLSIDNGTDTCVVTMDEAQSVTATFTLNTYDLTVSLNGTGEGSVTSVPEGISCEEDCSETYNYGTVVTLTPTPGIGSTFTGWNAVCDEEPAPDRLDLNTCVITIDEAKNLVILISAFGI